ncbi:MAP7 domain-containing protein 1-like [Procambarus clarkii]|uniref:MAP7 domain-containing protein 1-like n=1 Tax=Procambarus clarkii TaxID=6728 RepID=UPI0037427FB0
MKMQLEAQLRREEREAQMQREEREAQLQREERERAAQLQLEERAPQLQREEREARLQREEREARLRREGERQLRLEEIKAKKEVELRHVERGLPSLPARRDDLKAEEAESADEIKRLIVMEKFMSVLHSELRVRVREAPLLEAGIKDIKAAAD